MRERLTRGGFADHAREERGFTLIELMVVVLIIGILIAIALPTFLGARKRAQDRAAETNLRTGVAAAMTYWSEAGDYNGFDATVAETMEPSLDWRGSGVAPTAGQITIQAPAGSDPVTELLLVTHSQSGRYFCLGQLPNSPVFESGNGAAFADVDTTAECSQGW